MTPRPHRLLLTGLGNVGRAFVEILLSHGTYLERRYGFRAVVVGAADSSGAAVAPAGLPLEDLLVAKRAGRGVASLAGVGRPGMTATDLVAEVDGDLLLESTPTNLQDGQPGLDCVRIALRRGLAAVLASKGPLVLAYAELAGLSDIAAPDRPAVRFSAAVGGALPTINAGRRDLAGGRITRFEGVLNGTTQIVLQLMGEGRAFNDALAHARAIGITETDPSLDVDGWDAANKLVIVANAVLGRPTTLGDVGVTGIRDVTVEEVVRAREAGGRISLLAVAEPVYDGGGEVAEYRLSVRPTVLPPGHPLAGLTLDEMGAVYESDIYGRLTIAAADQGPRGTAAAMLRDLLELTGARG